MKIYISGRITGLPLSEVRQRFEDAAIMLEDIGFEAVNPLNNGLEHKASWKEHIVADIRMLLDCDAIYMMDNWMESRGAGIEYDIANRLNLDVWFESKICRENQSVLRIQNAIHEVMGLRFNQYTTKCRKREHFFARMLFVYHCRQLKMTLTQIAGYIHRDHSSMLHFLRKYDDDYTYNPQFREMATKVNELLNPLSKDK
ncbi:MAG: DUF4406 domain-containing protein [Ruminococcus sp.]|nr:DUF4406 domain-containing protein [Ruminococcus sp.]